MIADWFSFVWQHCICRSATWLILPSAAAFAAIAAGWCTGQVHQHGQCRLPVASGCCAWLGGFPQAGRLRGATPCLCANCKLCIPCCSTGCSSPGLDQAINGWCTGRNLVLRTYLDVMLLHVFVPNIRQHDLMPNAGCNAECMPMVPFPLCAAAAGG
jgi:hypothetical protein